MKINTHELAWAAGFFDGEGCTSFRPAQTRKRSRAVCVSIAQISVQPLERFRAAVGGLGAVASDGTTSSGKAKYVFRVASFEAVQAIIAMLWKWLSGPKRAQAIEALRRFHAVSVRPMAREAKHGTVSRYSSTKHQCRCAACRAAYAEYHRNHRKGASPCPN